VIFILFFFFFQVSGCLSYSDKISDGFYSILGMDPYLWLMCNNSEDGKRIPSLLLLKETEPNDTSMEVVLIDRREDSRLKELEDKAHELYCSSDNMLVLVEKLGRLVAVYMGYVHFLFLFPQVFFIVVHIYIRCVC